MIPNYHSPNMALWTGRIDDETNFDAFRIHQWIKPLDLNLDDRTTFAGALGFALLGFPCDLGVDRNLGRTGAANGPNAIRKELRNKPCNFSSEIPLYDAGDIAREGLTLEEAQHSLSLAVDSLLERGLFPLLLGGGHEIAFGHYLGLEHFLAKRANKTLGVVNFDAHFDLRPYPNGGSSGTMFRQISDRLTAGGNPFKYVAIGIQKSANTVDLFKTAQRIGTCTLLAKDLSEGDLLPHLDTLDHFLKSCDHLYITICSDVFSSAFAPGVSSAQPLGMHPERLLKILKHILRRGNTLSLDIAEVSPRFDQDNSTANLAAIILYAVITTLAEEKDLA